MLESQRRLYTLELFQFASVKADTAEKAPEIPTKVVLKEGKHRKVNFSLGYGSEERARAEVDYGGSTSSAAARVANAVVRYSGLDRGVRLNLTEPYFFSRNYSLTFSGQSWHSDEPAFVLDTTGGRVTSRAGSAAPPGRCSGRARTRRPACPSRTRTSTRTPASPKKRWTTRRSATI